MRDAILADIDAICSIYRTVGAAMFDEVRSRLAGRVLTSMEPILESHTKLLEAAKRVRKAQFAYGPTGGDPDWPAGDELEDACDALQPAIAFAEPESEATG